MKLLGWMHRKFRQNSDEQFKDFVIGYPCNCLSGQPSVDDEHCTIKKNYSTKPSFTQAWKDNLNHLPGTFTDVDSDGEEGNYQEDSVAAAAELFHGFLTIGTLGSDTVTTEPSTPTFPHSVEYIAEKETEVTENELKLINDELEKVLAAEVKEDFGDDNSSGRTSLVSTERSSHCSSTITLGGKPILEAQEANNGHGGSDVCPLKEYLFGSAIELPDTNAAVKKERRMSLGELFQRTKMMEDSDEAKSEKEKQTAAMHLIRKIKKLIHGATGSCGPAAGASTDATIAETKLRKILQMFHRKVHPDNPRAAKKKVEKNPISDNGGKNQMLQSRKRGMNAHKSFRFSITNCLKNNAEPPQHALEESGSNGNRECWIKTDADYLVLEL